MTAFKTKIEIATDSYNDRRYGKPWIAIVDFSANAQGDYVWGDFVGRPGDAGLLVLEATPGDIIAKGQRDNRKPSNSTTQFYQLQTDGTLGPEITKAEAYKLAKDGIQARDVFSPAACAKQFLELFAHLTKTEQAEVIRYVQENA